VVVTFSRDGHDLDGFYCDCGIGSSGTLCKHIIVTVLTAQNGIRESKLVLGKTATAETVVNGQNTAKAVGSGSLDVFSTPMLAALMEQAACDVLKP
jgi:hypothetical protein